MWLFINGNNPQLQEDFDKIHFKAKDTRSCFKLISTINTHQKKKKKIYQDATIFFSVILLKYLQ